MKKTLNEFTKEYLQSAHLRLKPRTLVEYRRLLDKLILPEFGDRLLTNLTTARIEQWFLGLAAVTPVQANRALAAFSAVMKLAVRWEHVENNPCRGIRRAAESEGVEHYLEPEDVKALVEVIPTLKPAEGSFLLVALYTGARPDELVNVQWEQYKDAAPSWVSGNDRSPGGYFELPDSKTGRRTIYLPPAALSALAAVHGPETGPVFPGVNPQNLWRRVRRKAKLPKDCRLYDLRHTFASTALGAGLSLEVIGQLLGHKRTQTTKRYARLQTGAGSEAAARVGAALSVLSTRTA